MAQETRSLEGLGELKTVAPASAPEHVQKLDKLGRAYATGKRKNAIARVWLKPGKGMITVNAKDFTHYPLRHMGVFNVLFCDGHAVSMTQSDLGDKLFYFSGP